MKHCCLWLAVLASFIRSGAAQAAPCFETGFDQIVIPTEGGNWRIYLTNGMGFVFLGGDASHPNTWARGDKIRVCRMEDGSDTFEIRDITQDDFDYVRPEVKDPEGPNS